MAQWLRFYAPNAGDPGSIPSQGTRSHMSQLRVHTQQLRILQATIKENVMLLLQEEANSDSVSATVSLTCFLLLLLF